MSPRDRLCAVQRELVARGVQDVKISFAPEASALSFDTLADSVAEFLEAYLRGDYKVIDVKRAAQEAAHTDRLNWGD